MSMKRYIIALLLVATAMTSWASSSDRQQCREWILGGSFDEAVGGYAALIEVEKAARNEVFGVDEDLLAEYAYALALAGYYDGAVVNIDRARLLGKKDTDFYTAQILSLMNYQELADMFWTTEHSQAAPAWLASFYKSLAEKHKGTPVIGGSDPDAAFRRANELASRKQYVQSVVIYQELADNYPDNSVIHVGYSTVLENMKKLSPAAKELKKGIDLLAPEQASASAAFNAHLTSLNNQISALNSKTWAERMLDKYEPSTILYAGGAAGADVFSLTGRLGFYTNTKTSGSINIGYSYASSVHAFNIGVSAYQTMGRLVFGLGINEAISSSDNVFSITPAVGITFLNKTKDASYDILLNYMIPVKSGYPTTLVVSFGRTFYFSYKGRK